MKIIIIINIICFCLAIYWTWQSRFESEPVIVTLSLLATLIGVWIKKVTSKKVKVKGNRNTTIQKEQAVNAEIEGNDNLTIQ